MDIPQTFAAIKNPTFIKLKLTVSMFIILGYVNNYGKNRYLLERSCISVTTIKMVSTVRVD